LLLHRNSKILFLLRREPHSFLMAKPPYAVAPQQHSPTGQVTQLTSRINVLTLGQKRPIMRFMNGKEFIKRVRKIGKSKGLSCLVDEARGKGSHVTLYLGDNLTIVRNPKDDLKAGTFHAMLKQLEITLDEIMGA
jgi:mRNA interferase HicA